MDGDEKEKFTNGQYFCRVDQKWDEHQEKTFEAINKVNMMHSHILEMKGDTKYLNQLPVIAAALQDLKSSNLSDIKKEIRGSGSRILNYATIIILGILLVILLLKDSNKDLHLGRDGMDLRNSDKN